MSRNGVVCVDIILLLKGAHIYATFTVGLVVVVVWPWWIVGRLLTLAYHWKRISKRKATSGKNLFRCWGRLFPHCFCLSANMFRYFGVWRGRVFHLATRLFSCLIYQPFHFHRRDRLCVAITTRLLSLHPDAWRQKKIIIPESFDINLFVDFSL